MPGQQRLSDSLYGYLPFAAWPSTGLHPGISKENGDLPI
jgi:hypothetical protein